MEVHSPTSTLDLWGVLGWILTSRVHKFLHLAADKHPQPYQLQRRPSVFGEVTNTLMSGDCLLRRSTSSSQLAWAVWDGAPIRRTPALLCYPSWPNSELGDVDLGRERVPGSYGGLCPTFQSVSTDMRRVARKTELLPEFNSGEGSARLWASSTALVHSRRILLVLLKIGGKALTS